LLLIKQEMPEISFAKPKKTSKKVTKSETHQLQFYPSKAKALSAVGFNKYTGFMIVI
jgi:hypothetical protein